MPKYKAASQTKKDTASSKKKRRAIIREGHSKMMTHALPVVLALVAVILGFLKYVTSSGPSQFQ
jgi:hypothetical protein